MKRFYETKRLKLVVLDPMHAEAVLKFYLNNVDFLAPWESERPEGFYTVSFQRKVLSLEEEAFLKGQMVRLWIFSKDDFGLMDPLGSISLTNIIRGVFQSCFLGYKLDKSSTGMGYMTEAVEKVVQIAFVDLGLHRIEANIMPRNIKSMQVAIRAGFENEGLAKSYLRINGVWEDHYHMVKINGDML